MPGSDPVSGRPIAVCQSAGPDPRGSGLNGGMTNSTDSKNYFVKPSKQPKFLQILGIRKNIYYMREAHDSNL